MTQADCVNSKLFPIDLLRSRKIQGLPLDNALLDQWARETIAAYEMAHPGVMLDVPSIKWALCDVLNDLPQVI